jgi:tRNA nucleotidyltransferase/poly(A) polymerase
MDTGREARLPAWQRDVIARGKLYLVGGSVRDALLLGAEKDLDFLVTGVAADDLTALLRAHGRVEVVGRAFGVLRLRADGSEETVDVALPRREVSTGVGHRDFAVDCDPSLPVEADLGRRDFTMNAIAKAIPSGEIVDPFGGCADIAARRLRMVFPAAFRDDPLRMLRAAQFVARFGLEVEPRTREALCADARLAPTVSPERIQEEITKLLALADAPSVGWRLMRDTGLLAPLFPELAKTVGVTQPGEWHLYDVFEHSIRAVDAAPRESLVVRLAALLHDTGKADRRREIDDEKLGRKRVVFYGHEEVSRADARAVLERLRYPRALAERVDTLIAAHMFDYHDGWSDAAVRRLIARVGRDAIDDLLALRRADQIGSGVPRELARTEALRARVAAELARHAALTVRDLAVDGGDVMRVLGVGPGPAVGRVLAALLDEALEDPAHNQRERLLARIRELGAEGAAP